MVRASDATGLDIKHMVVVAIVVMLELTVIRNVELIVEKPLKDGEKSSSFILICYYTSKYI